MASLDQINNLKCKANNTPVLCNFSCRATLAALTVISSFVAAGVLYPHIGYASLGVAGAGFVLAVALMCCAPQRKNPSTLSSQTPIQSPTDLKPISSPQPRNEVTSQTIKMEEEETGSSEESSESEFDNSVGIKTHTEEGKASQQELIEEPQVVEIKENEAPLDKSPDSESSSSTDSDLNLNHLCQQIKEVSALFGEVYQQISQQKQTVDTLFEEVSPNVQALDKETETSKPFSAEEINGVSGKINPTEPQKTEREKIRIEVDASVESLQITDKLIIGSVSKRIKVWERVSGKQLRGNYKGHNENVTCLKIAGNLLISSAKEPQIRIWDLQAHECVNILDAHREWAQCLEVKDKILVSGSGGVDSEWYDIKIWNLETGARIRVLEGHEYPITALQICENILFSSSSGGDIRKWNLETGELLASWAVAPTGNLEEGKATTYIQSLKIHQGILFAGYNDGTLVMFAEDEKDLVSVEIYKGHTDAVKCIQGLDENTVVSGSKDGTVRFWSIFTGKCIQVLQGNGQSINDIQVDGNTIFTGSGSNSMRSRGSLLEGTFNSKAFEGS